MKPLAQNTLIQNRYLVVHLIGKGGMGEVYLAVDQRLGSAVALKRTFFAGDDMLGNAFEREARTLARMRHPVLPKVSDHFGEGDEQYLVMEHISGDDLSKRLEAAGKPFPVSWVLFWADQLLDALSYLHTHEPPIIHRDIKPQNLKLTDENHIILLDFGLSKTSTGHTNISQSGSTGSIVGYTPHYAPMEQIRGIGTSPRSDLYSLSATLYQLLTNNVPADALSRADAMLNGLSDPITPPHELNPEVPKAVSEVLLRAMEVSQEKRYANAREMQRVLRKAFNEIHQATTASTVAFTAEQAEAAGVVGPSSSPEPESAAKTRVSGPLPEPAQQAPPPAALPADMDATMAFDPHDSQSEGRKQSDVKTEVFVSGSLLQPPAEAAPPVSQNFDSLSASGDGGYSPAASQGFEPGATVPFFKIDESAADERPAEPEFFEAGVSRDSDPEESPQYRSSESEPEAAAAATSYAAPAPARPVVKKKSSGKMIAVIGALAAVVLLAAAIGGGVWAYINLSPKPTPTPTPEPSPEETVFTTPSPEPTVESNTNVDIGNTGNSSNTNDNSDILVSPTPDDRPERDPTPGPDRPQGTRTPPPPRTGPTVRPPSTPVGPRTTPTRRPPRTTATPVG